MAGMRLPTRLGILTTLFAAPFLLIAQTAPADHVTPITSALRAGQFDAALHLLQLELAQNPKSAQLWALDGIALSGKGDKKESLAAFRHALSISPDYLPALEGAAQIEYENGSKDAVTLLQHVVQLLPNDPTSHAMLAVLAWLAEEVRLAAARSANASFEPLMRNLLRPAWPMLHHDDASSILISTCNRAMWHWPCWTQ